MRRIAFYLLVFLVWNLLVSAALLLGTRRGLEALGLVLSLLLYVAVLRGFLLRGSSRRCALLRLRPLTGDTLRWTVIAAPVLLFLSWAVGEVYVRLVPVPPTSFDPFAPLMQTPLGRLSITVLAVGVAPVLEEFFFRGLIQRSLERRIGTAPGILAAALLFALIHFLPWVFPLHLFLGAAFGYVVYLTRSIWSGVALHAVNNAAAVAGMGLQSEDPEAIPTIWATGPDTEWWLSLVALGIAGMLAARTVRGLRETAGRRRLRTAEAAP